MFLVNDLNREIHCDDTEAYEIVSG